LQTGFEDYPSFHDPMCGSGTFISEALMINTRCPANFSREDFAFMKWADYEPHTWRELKENLSKDIIEPTIEFSGSDIDRSIMFGAKKNIVQIPFGDQVEIFKKDFLKGVIEPKPSFMIMNPPYDVRLESDDILQFYADIGTKLKHEYTGSRACIFSGNLDALKHVGLRTSKKLNLLNGQIPSKLHVFDLFEGKRQ